MHVATLSEIWRYPVKSMGGERLNATSIHTGGISGDRGWALLDKESRDITGGKLHPRLLDLSASYHQNPPDGRAYADDLPGIDVRFPDGSVVGANASEAISRYVGKDLELASLQPPENLDHYRSSNPMTEAGINKILGINPGEDPPDMSVFSNDILAMLAEYVSPPGAYHDVYPLHIITTSSLAHMSDIAGVDFDVRRFRPSLLLETPAETNGLAEFEWVGKKLRIGELELGIESRTIRCSMPSRGQIQAGLEPLPLIARTLYQQTNRFLGVNAIVLSPGRVCRGDAVELLNT